MFTADIYVVTEKTLADAASLIDRASPDRKLVKEILWAALLGKRVATTKWLHARDKQHAPSLKFSAITLHHHGLWLTEKFQSSHAKLAESLRKASQDASYESKLVLLTEAEYRRWSQCRDTKSKCTLVSHISELWAFVRAKAKVERELSFGSA